MSFVTMYSRRRGETWGRCASDLYGMRERSASDSYQGGLGAAKKAHPAGRGAQVLATFDNFKRLPVPDRVTMAGLLYAMLDFTRDEVRRAPAAVGIGRLV